MIRASPANRSSSSDHSCPYGSGKGELAQVLPARPLRQREGVRQLVILVPRGGEHRAVVLPGVERPLHDALAIDRRVEAEGVRAVEDAQPETPPSYVPFQISIVPHRREEGAVHRVALDRLEDADGRVVRIVRERDLPPPVDRVGRAFDRSRTGAKRGASVRCARNPRRSHVLRPLTLEYCPRIDVPSGSAIATMTRVVQVHFEGVQPVLVDAHLGHTDPLVRVDVIRRQLAPLVLDHQIERHVRVRGSR